jgi:aminopeptidase N
MICRALITTTAVVALVGSSACARGGSARQDPTPSVTLASQPAGPPPTRSEILRGEYGRLRANNDLLYYHLDVRVDPDKKYISGKNLIRFRMLSDDNRIQIDLHPSLAVDRILLDGAPLKYTREESAVFIDFPQTLKKGNTYAIDFQYSGTPLEISARGGIGFRRDANGHPFINTVCEGTGSSTWWPSKDQWHDEVDSMQISVTIPNGLSDVSNGAFAGKTDLGDGYTRWDWKVHYPINSYDVSMNIGDYVHFTDTYKDMTLDFYVLRDSLEKAKAQFTQAKGTLAAYEHYFGEYPFKKDGYKLVEATNAGMEHQSAVTYGNGFKNGYGGRDWTGVGVSPKFDFIIIHESGHEWFGNAVSASDRSDMWIHEGWTTYLEVLYVEYTFGYDDALKYVNGYKSHVQNRQPIIPAGGLMRTPPQDMYFKGALMLNTLRNVVNNDARWFALIHDLYQHFKYQNISTDDIVAFFNQRTGRNLTPVFNQYLRHTALPTLELKFDSTAKTVSYRWQTDEPGFAMPIRVGAKGAWQIVEPVTDKWKTMPTRLTPSTFDVATDLYFVNVVKQ